MIDSGILLVNKDAGMTSRDVVNIVSKYLKTKKVGHLGTLDPLATGLMVLTINDATKIGSILVMDDKSYIAEASIGLKTDTGDITGKVIEESSKEITKEELIEALKHFHTSYEQQVPIYSAVKINGKKLYEYARAGETIELPKRLVDIKKIDLLTYDDRKFSFKVKVSKGTYIRSLIEDIGTYLGVPMTMSKLNRTNSGQFSLDDAYTLEEIKNGNYKLISIKDTLQDYSTIEVDSSLLFKVNNGQKLDDIYHQQYVLFTHDNNVIGIYEKDGLSKIKPLHIFHH